MIDFHNHFLPNIDDGSQSLDCSYEMLKISKAQNIDIIVATPHFYVEENTADNFLKERKIALKNISKHLIEKKEFLDVDIALGAEVAYFDNISEYDNIEKLCIEGTKVMLLELPFYKWTNSVYDNVFRLSNRGITCIIAHIERYKKINDIQKSIYDLRDCGAYIQSNARLFTDFWQKNSMLKMLSNGDIDILGSDSHNMDNRSPNLGFAFDEIQEKLGDDIVSSVNETEKYLIDGAYTLCI